jgi:internalin A
MGSLKSLRIIVLNGNQFASFPEILCQLPLLTGMFSIILKSLSPLDIHIARNKLPSLHQDLTNLKHLRVLSLEYNLFKSVPEVIYSIETLEELALTGNEIGVFLHCSRLLTLGEISESLGKLTNLKKLELAETKLRVLPNAISQLTRLNILNVEFNSLLDFPTGIQACTSLKYIRVHFFPILL